MKSLPITGVILAGGKGRRFSSRDKGLVEVAGRPLVEYAIELLETETSELIISANRHIKDYERYGFRVVTDALPDYPGPLAGMLAGLQDASNEFVVFVPCDMPYLPSALVARMYKTLIDSAADVCVPNDGERNHPVIAMMRHSLEDVLRAYLSAGNRKVGDWVAAQKFAVADFSDTPESFRNLNRPEDVQSG